jgi:hypothetical protein
MSVVLSGRSLCDELISRTADLYQLWLVFGIQKTFKNEGAMVRLGPQRHQGTRVEMFIFLIL